MQRVNGWLWPVLFAVFYLPPLNFRDLWTPDETRYAEISREMLAGGNWTVPHLLGLRYFEKPVLGYWLNNISQWVFGHDNFAVRLVPVLATALSGALIFWVALRFWRSRAKAGAAALIYMSMLLVYSIGTLSVLDAQFSACMTAAMACFVIALEATGNRRRLIGYALLGLCCGVGFLTKGFIALAVPVVAILPYMLYRRRFLELLKFGPVAVIAAAIVSAPWAITIQLREPDYWHYFFWVQNIQRFAGADAQHEQPIWYFLPVLVLGCLPWLGLLPDALRHAWRNRHAHPEFVYLLCWLVFPFVFFSLSKGKLATYILPCFAPLALIAGAGVIAAVEAATIRPLKLNAAVNAGFGLLGIVVLYWLAWSPAGGKPVYGPQDSLAWWLGLLSFAGWALFGLLQWLWPLRGWALSALCPGTLALLLAWALPQSVINDKNPEVFINAHRAQLGDIPTLLAGDVGLGTSLGWALRRSDIKLFDNEGELAYGLSYPDVHDKEIQPSRFPSWLATARRQGRVALLMKFDNTRRCAADYLKSFPGGYQLFVQNRLILMIYPEATP